MPLKRRTTRDNPERPRDDETSDSGNESGSDDNSSNNSNEESEDTSSEGSSDTVSTASSCAALYVCYLPRLSVSFLLINLLDAILNRSGDSGISQQLSREGNPATDCRVTYYTAQGY